MRLATLLFLLLSPLAVAQTYVGVIDPAGDPSLHDLDWRDGTLYATETGSDRIVTIAPDGTVATATALGFDPRGVAWDGTDYRVSTGFDTSSPEILTLSTSGMQVGTLPSPTALANGLTFHDGLLWVAKAYPDDEASIVGVDPATGAEIETIAFPSTQPTGIAFLGDGTLWASNAGDDSGSSGDYTLYHIDRATGSVLGTVGVPDGTTRPRGLAFDGEGLLYVTVREGATSHIYLLTLSESGNAEIALSDESLDLGIVVDGETATVPLSITNTGDGVLQITDVVISGIPENPGTFSTTLADLNVDPGATETVQVSFLADRNPPDPTGEASAFLMFRTNDVQNPEVSISLTAFAAEPEATGALCSSNTHDFGSVRIDETAFSLDVLEVCIQNVGATPLRVTGSTSTNSAFSLYAPDALPRMQPGQRATVRVEFRPTTIGLVSGTFGITFNSPAAPVTLSLSGTGIDPDLAPGSPIWTHTVPDNPSTSFDEPKVSHLFSPGDITGDGLPDLVYASRNYLTVALDANGWGEAPLLWQVNTCFNSFNCGAVSGVQQLFDTGLGGGVDLNADGTPDIVIATEGGNDHVYALDGKNGHQIWAWGSDADPYLASYYSVSVRPEMDVTGDGVPDVASGTGTASPESPNPFNNRRVYFFDGATGNVLWNVGTGLPNFRTMIYDPGQGLGLRVASGGGEDPVHTLVSLNASNGSGAWTTDPGFSPFLIEPIPDGDGEDLIVAGSQGFNSSLGRWDGATGTAVWQRGSGAGSVWDLALIPREGLSTLVVAGTSDATVRAYDGDTGTPVWSVSVGDQGFGVETIGDVDRDGTDDVAVVGKAGVAFLLSGVDGTEVWRYQFGDGSFDLSGESVAVVPDIDGNSIPEVAFGTRDGRVFLLFGGGGRVGVPSESGPEADALTLDAPFPSPTSGPVTLRYRLAEPGEVTIQVLDVLGREVWARAADQPVGSYALDVPTDALAPGSYVVRLGNGVEAVTRRFVVVR